MLRPIRCHLCGRTSCTYRRVVENGVGEDRTVDEESNFPLEAAPVIGVHRIHDRRAQSILRSNYITDPGLWYKLNHKLAGDYEVSPPPGQTQQQMEEIYWQYRQTFHDWW